MWPKSSLLNLFQNWSLTNKLIRAFLKQRNHKIFLTLIKFELFCAFESLSVFCCLTFFSFFERSFGYPINSSNSLNGLFFYQAYFAKSFCQKKNQFFSKRWRFLDTVVNQWMFWLTIFSSSYLFPQKSLSHESCWNTELNVCLWYLRELVKQKKTQKRAKALSKKI